MRGGRCTIAHNNVACLSSRSIPSVLSSPMSSTLTLTALDALIQVGLIQRVEVTGRDAFGEKTTDWVYRFFHDKYTEYRLSAVLRQDTLGQVTTTDLKDNCPTKLINTIETLVISSMAFPILTGALDHW